MASLSNRKKRGASVSADVFSKVLCAVAAAGGTWEDVATQVNAAVKGAAMTKASAPAKRAQLAEASLKLMEERYKKQLEHYDTCGQVDNKAKLEEQIKNVVLSKFPNLGRASRVKSSLAEMFGELDIDMDIDENGEDGEADGLTIE